MLAKRSRGGVLNPITYDNLSRGNRWAVKWGPLEEGEIADVARPARGSRSPSARRRDAFWRRAMERTGPDPIATAETARAGFSGPCNGRAAVQVQTRGQAQHSPGRELSCIKLLLLAVDIQLSTSFAGKKAAMLVGANLAVILDALSLARPPLFDC